MDCPNIKRQKGQTLVIVLVVLIIAAVVTTAVAYRAIQDIRLSAEERSSALAAAQIDSLLDIAMEEDFWSTLWAVEGAEQEAGPCSTFGAGDACRIDTPFWETYITSDVQCDDWSVSARRHSTGIDSFFLGKDEVLEVDLRDKDGNDRSEESLKISWNGDADYLILKYYDDGELTEAVALTYENPSDWPEDEVITLFPLGDTYIYEFGTSDVVRIRAVGGDALLGIDGLAEDYYQFGELKAHCYIGDVYREYLSQFMLRGAAPGVLDYVLFDATGIVSGSSIE
jgi:type II secretory pathway pseudopilin PulG